MGKYLVFDLETETHERHKRKASPFVMENWVVARGWKKQGDQCNSWSYHPKHDRTTTLVIDPDVTLIVGFNIKFDLLWEMCQGNTALHEFYKRGGQVWDCQYAEYLLRGQHPDSQMCSLDSIVESYGGRKKIDEVKLLWEAGVKTSEIQEDLLIDYLVGTEEESRNSGDIGNTELIFLGQVKLAVRQNQVKMIQDRMDGLLCTTEMEFRGLKVDIKEAARALAKRRDELATVSKELAGHLPELPFEFNWGSRTQLSCLLFGGTVKYIKPAHYVDEKTGELARKKAYEDWPLVNGWAVHPDRIEAESLTQDTFVSGAKKGTPKFRRVEVQGPLKTRLTDFFHEFPGITAPKDEWKGAQTDAKGGPVYGTGSDIIEELGKRDIPFLKALSKKQKLDKEIGTYYVVTKPNGQMSGMLTCVQPADHMLHHKLNHSSTVTTRLSSNDPNLQNLPRNDLDADGHQKSEVKAMFVSRFGEMGTMIEADYSQLEVVIQGVLSRDPALCQDLRDKIDFHCKRVSAKFGITYEAAVDWCKNDKHEDYKNGKKERTKCKIFSFQRAYGAGATTIALETGMSVEEVQDLMQKEDEMYPGVVRFNAEVESAVIKSAVPFNAAGEDGAWKTYRRGLWQAPTGTIYSFRSHDAPAFLQKRGQKDSFSPPELKNYPVQGFGGEVVQGVALGRLWRHFVSRDFYEWRAFLVNTVHDCVWADSMKEVRDEVCTDIKRVMESIPEWYNTRYGMQIDVPFPAEVEVGANMNNMAHWHAAA